MRTKIVQVKDLKIGDEVDMGSGSWSFKIGSLEAGRIATKIKDEHGVTWREPSPEDTIKIWIESDTE